MPTDGEQPIHIQADSAELDQTKGLAIYHGNVKMDQGSMHVAADTMTIEIQNEQVIRITAEGRQAHYGQKVNETDPEVLADADTIIYHTQDGKVELIGNARLTQTPNEFSGEVIHYDINAGKVDAKSPQSGTVRMTLKPAPQQLKQPQKQPANEGP